MDTNQIIFLSANNDSSSSLSEKLRPLGLTVKELQFRQEVVSELQTDCHYSLIVYRCQAVSQDLLDLLGFLTRNSIKTRLLVSAKSSSVEDAVQCLKAGAIDFVISDQPDARLMEAVVRSYSQCDHGNGSTSLAADGMEAIDPVLIGKSHAIGEIRSAVNLVARSQTTVLITGESGTGKEVVSRLVHLKSNRRNKPFVPLNCAALPKDVIENELFGHEKGAFTGALLKKQGCFEIADKGTLFFDEIAEMSLDTQAKLLRAIETQKFRRLGGKEEVSVDVRIIAATNKNITSALASKELREDLYYRLSVIEIFIPPLRERKEDIAPLVDHFLTMFSVKYGRPRQQFSESCLEIMRNYDWPGNVREMCNIIERALVICPHPVIGSQYIPQKIKTLLPTQVHINIPLGISSQEAERILIIQTLASAGNNKSKTAKILGLSRKTLHNKLASFSQT